MPYPTAADLYDPPTYGGTPQQEALAEMIQIFGGERPDRQWILSDFDTWERNPYYHGPEQQHPEDDHSEAEWQENQAWLATMAATASATGNTALAFADDDCPF